MIDPLSSIFNLRRFRASISIDGQRAICYRVKEFN